MRISKAVFGVFLATLTLTHSVHARETRSSASRAAVLGFHDNAVSPPLVPLLNQAARTIDIEIYEMEDEGVRTALRSALARGVTIRVVQEPDSMGEHCEVFASQRPRDAAACLDMKQLVDEVRHHGGAYEPFNKTLCGNGSAHCFQHGKLAIVDDATVLISTGNFNSTSLCNLAENPDVCNRDYTYVTVDSDVLAATRAIFEKDLKGRPYDLEAVMTAQVEKKLTVSPGSLPDILRFIDSARRTVQIENQYLNDPALNAALLAASKRGVEVSVTVSSACAFGRPSPFKYRQIANVFEPFDRAHISSRFFTRSTLINGKPGYLHAKAIIVDKSRAWLGSMNGSTMASMANREFGVFFSEPAAVQALAALMVANHTDHESETWGESLRCRNDGP